MSTLYNLIVMVQVISALAIIGLVLIQHGKGADMGAAFGSGASGSLFGASGSSNFMSRSTGVAAAIFFSTTLALASMSGQRNSATGGGVMERAAATAPAKPATGAVIPATVPAAPAASAPAAPAAAAPASSTQSGQIPK
jgi:preprotein translocase subunit SecG